MHFQDAMGILKAPHDEKPKLIRREDLWFDDGNVVFQAQDAVFRVHKSVLCRESAFFRDMFSLPQPLTLRETYDGCPLVKVQDSVEDISLFLAVIFDHKYVNSRLLFFSVVYSALLTYTLQCSR